MPVSQCQPIKMKNKLLEWLSWKQTWTKLTGPMTIISNNKKVMRSYNKFFIPEFQILVF